MDFSIAIINLLLNPFFLFPMAIINLLLNPNPEPETHFPLMARVHVSLGMVELVVE
jgi:hypothetical protein